MSFDFCSHLPWYQALPAAVGAVLLWAFVGLVWCGVYNNYLVRRGMWDRVGQDGGIFWGTCLWPLFMGFVLLVETVCLLGRVVRGSLRPLGPVVAAFFDWVEGPNPYQ